MIIRQTPCFHLTDLIRKGNTNHDIFPLGSKNSYLFYGARYAIWAGLKVLGITPGHNILIPSYNCGTEIDPVLDQNVQAKYYRINRNMTIDLEDLIKRIDKYTSAILIIHYMGFPQPIEEIKNICKTRDIFLIEDCAHAFLSTYKSKPLGAFGDISVFSIRKTIPIPNGGALAINNAKFKYEDKKVNGSFLSPLFVSVELLKNKTQTTTSDSVLRLSSIFIFIISLMSYSIQLFLRVLRKISLYKGFALIHINYYCRDFSRELVRWKISNLSMKIMSHMNPEKIKERRRNNYEYLLTNLRNFKNIDIVFNSLPEGVCPLFFPIIVKDRQNYYQKFKEKGITLFQYWRHMHHDVPWDKFPEAVFLKNHILGLPVHQDISFNHLDRIIEVFKDIQRNGIERRSHEEKIL